MWKWKCPKKIIILYYTNNLYPICPRVPKHDCLCNMQAELALLCMWHTKLAWREHTCHFGMHFARIDIWGEILMWWELGLEMVHGVVLWYVWAGRMPPVGGWGLEKVGMPDFQRAIHYSNFCTNFFGGESERGISPPPSWTANVGIDQPYIYFQQTGRAILGPNSR